MILGKAKELSDKLQKEMAMKQLPDNVKQANDSLVLFIGVAWLSIMTGNILAWGVILILGYLFNLACWYFIYGGKKDE